MFDPGGMRVGGGAAGQFGDGQGSAGGDEDGVPEAFAAQHRRVGDQGELGEDGGDGGDLAAEVRERGPSARFAA